MEAASASQMCTVGWGGGAEGGLEAMTIAMATDGAMLLGEAAVGRDPGVQREASAENCEGTGPGKAKVWSLRRVFWGCMWNPAH